MADATQSSLKPDAPQRFGKYWLDAELAQGGMSRVLRARLRGPGGFEKKLVVKQILPQLAQDPGFIELFVREANTLVQMSHPNIVPVYELGVVDGVYFLAMELVEGATVAELLHDGPLPEAQCAHIGAQVCEALRYAHERFGLVHRDVTPRNVIVDAGGHVRLLDFGIAAPLAHTGRGELFGSPGYMSPEQTRGQSLGPQSDLFSLGTVLYEALSGERALPQPEGVDASPHPPRLAASHGTSPELHAIVEELLALDPALRPSSAAVAGARFRTWLAQTHPEGVASTLGHRAEQARARAAQHADKPPVAIHGGAGATPHLTRSIATSAQLAELLHEGTEPLERKAAPAAEPSPSGRRLRWLLASLFAAFAAALLVQRTSGPGHGETRAPTHATERSHGPQPVETLEPARPPEPATAPAGSTPSEPATSGTAPAVARAHLSVNALPWAQLRLDGRPLGVTPQRALSVSVGPHLIELDCPPLGRKARVPLKVNAGDHPHVLVDLNANPAQVSVR